MALASVGIDGRTGVTKGSHEVDVLVDLPLEGVVVVIYEDGIRPALMGHLKSLDDPVETCCSVTTQSGLVGSGLVAGYRLVDHIDNLKIGIMFCHGIKILLNGLCLL